MSPKVARQEIWYVDLNPVRGHEQAKNRPCLVVSPTRFNQGPAKLAVVIPITSKYRALSWFVSIPPNEARLTKPSFIMCNQIRTVSLCRFGDRLLGTISEDTMRQVENRLRILLEL